VPYYEQALKFNAKEIYALIGLANALYDLNEPLKAIDHYLTALQIDDNLPDVHYNLANAYFLLGKTTTSIPYY
jgi:tetratricopeptide (TPR) repeat protein